MTALCCAFMLSLSTAGRAQSAASCPGGLTGAWRTTISEFDAQRYGQGPDVVGRWSLDVTRCRLTLRHFGSLVDRAQLAGQMLWSGKGALQMSNDARCLGRGVLNRYFIQLRSGTLRFDLAPQGPGRVCGARRALIIKAWHR